MDKLSFTFWAGAIAVLAVSVALSVVSARIRLPVLGALTAAPVVLALIGATLGVAIPPPHPVFAAIVALELFVLGVTAGSPLTLFVVELTEKHSVRVGAHGGIFPSATAQSKTEQSAIGVPDAPKEVLRGGATIGYLERIAVIGCLAVGRVEGIAVVVAIKGLGRFSELDSPEARERFIIGTLVSLIFSCGTGALLVLALAQ
jgi:hypothetical protein